jgi:hypothetical protein
MTLRPIHSLRLVTSGSAVASLSRQRPTVIAGDTVRMRSAGNRSLPVSGYHSLYRMGGFSAAGMQFPMLSSSPRSPGGRGLHVPKPPMHWPADRQRRLRVAATELHSKIGGGRTCRNCGPGDRSLRETVLRAAGWALVVNEPVMSADIIVLSISPVRTHVLRGHQR